MNKRNYHQCRLLIENFYFLAKLAQLSTKKIV